MPQLDKVSFLSQFFWLCIVFFAMYLILVKLFLPSLARIVKLRNSLGGSAEQGTSVGSSNKTSDIYNNSLQASIQAFQSHSSFLERWGSSKLNTILPKISPNFKESLLGIRKESLLAENLLCGVVPPVGRQQNLVFEDSLHKDWYTATLCNKLLNATDDE
jgi:hypothetical protein